MTPRPHPCPHSVPHAAPEVFLQKPYNCKADVFSMGVIMYELFSRTLLVFTHLGEGRGRFPTSGETGWHAMQPVVAMQPVAAMQPVVACYEAATTSQLRQLQRQW